MRYTRQNLINIYNGTSKEHPKGSDEIESYEHWLERQLIARIAKIEKLEKQIEPSEPVTEKSISLPTDFVENWIATEMPINTDDATKEETNKWCRKGVRLFAEYVRGEAKAIDLEEEIKKFADWYAIWRDRYDLKGEHMNFVVEEYLKQR